MADKITIPKSTYSRVTASGMDLNRVYVYQIGQTVIVNGMFQAGHIQASISNLPINKTNEYIFASCKGLTNVGGSDDHNSNFDPNATSMLFTGLTVGNYYEINCVYQTS